MDKLKNCPFCNSNHIKLVLSRNVCGTNGLDWIVEQHRWSARCNICKARGPIASGRVMPGHDDAMVSWQQTDSNLKQLAITLWNKRTDK